MLRQALLNLALNACQAMPNGGTLQARRAARRRAAASRSTSRTPASAFRPRTCSKIFDLYFTTKEKGSGIGLSMVYRIVQLHDGEVEVAVHPGARHTVPIGVPAGVNYRI